MNLPVRRTRRVDGWLAIAVLLGLAGLYLVTVLPNLSNDPIAGGDEGWIMSASAKLAEQGTFGSDLFEGFFGAGSHYFFNLPLHHLILAGVFKVAGVGIEQARLVSVLFGLATLGLTCALGSRIGGRVVGAGAAALLVLLRLNLTPFTGLTLTDLGATVRYDLIAVPYGLGASLLVLAAVRTALLRHVSALTGSWSRSVADEPGVDRSQVLVCAAGLLTGLGALTQFIGAFVAVPLTLFLLTEFSLRLRQRVQLAAVFGLAALLPFLPYAAYVATNWDDFRAQSRSFEQSSDFASPAFYVDQLLNEPDRYAIAVDLQEAPSGLSGIASRPSARLVFFLLGPAALILTARRALAGAGAHRLLALLLFGLILQLALFESTKRFVYWVVVVPYLCIALADLAVACLQWRPRGPNVALAARLALGAVAGVILLEGLLIAAKDVRDAGDAPSLEAAGRAIEVALPEGASAIGDNRLWPVLRGRPYRSLLLLFYYTNPRISRDEATDVFGAMDRIGADYLLLSPLSREILEKLTPEHADEFGRYLQDRAQLTTTVEAPGYGPIEVYRLRP